MREVPVPASPLEREKRARALKRRRTAFGVLFYLTAGIAILGLIGALVLVIVYELQGAGDQLYIILGGSLGGGTVLFALLAFLFARLLSRFENTLLDYNERCDGENSFFVGEGTLATFEKDCLRLHGEVKGKTKEIFIPNGQVRIFCVCTRKKPREKGEWAAVIEFPSHFLNAKADGKTLVQTDAKERFLRAAREHGFEIIQNDEPRTGKFKKQSEVFVRDADAKKKLLPVLLASVAAAAGVPIAIFLQTAVGSVLIVAGAFFAPRYAYAYARAKKKIALYEEGFYYCDKSGGLFLKWEEIGKIARDTEENAPVLRIELAYGSISVPAIQGAYEEIEARHPEKTQQKT